MSKKAKKHDVEGYGGEVLLPEKVEEKETVVPDLETLVTDLVTYIRTQEQMGVMNTAHGPLYILDPEALDLLIVPIEEYLGLPSPPTLKAVAAEPVQEDEPLYHEAPEEVIVPRESEMEMPREEEKHW